MSTDPLTHFECVSWNVHRGRGHGAHFDPERVHTALAASIAPLAPAVLALQEADFEAPPQAAIFDPARIADETGLIHAHAAPHMRRHDSSSGFFGAMFFLHRDITVTGEFVLDMPGHWHRGAVVIEAVLRGVRVRLVTTHLSRLEIIRIAQLRTLGQFIMRRPAMQTVLMGDMNDWRFWRGPAFHPRLVGTRFEGPIRPTFPVRRPFLPLDRILSDGPGRVEATRVLDHPTLRIASDHRPLWGRIALGARPAMG